jgi:hypothetical protein
MCARDILSHARPNAFDTLLHLQASRTTPHTSLTYHRASRQHMQRAGYGIRVSPSLKTYAGWFDEAQLSSSDRLYRLFPSSVSLRSMRPLNRGSFLNLLARGKPSGHRQLLHAAYEYPSQPRCREIARETLNGWMAEIAAATAALGSVDTARLGGFPVALALAATIEPRLLIEARKKGRAGDGAGARRSAEGMLESCAAFLRGIEGKTRDAA